MTVAAQAAGTRWFTDTRMRILVCEPTTSLIEAEAEQGNMPPLHVHHAEDEVFYVLEGRISISTAEGSVEIGAGESAFAPRGIPHVYRVESPRARWLAATTSGAFASFVDEMSEPATSEGFAPPELMPSPDALAAAAARRDIEILGPPGATP